VYGAQSKYSEAEALFKRALAIRETALGNGGPTRGDGKLFQERLIAGADADDSAFRWAHHPFKVADPREFQLRTVRSYLCVQAV
jgi:hypothetical protein